MRINEVEQRISKRPRAGGIPFFIEGPGQIWVCLITSTNPAFNGPDPCIPKGGADDGESPQSCAVREVEEETCIPANIYKKVFPVDVQLVTGLESSYHMHVFGMQCDRKVPTRPTREATSQWYTADQALRVIRTTHKGFLQKLLGMIQ